MEVTPVGIVTVPLQAVFPVTTLSTIVKEPPSLQLVVLVAADATGLTETATTSNALRNSAPTRTLTDKLRLKFFFDQNECNCLIVEI